MKDDKPIRAGRATVPPAWRAVLLAGALMIGGTVARSAEPSSCASDLPAVDLRAADASMAAPRSAGPSAADPRTPAPPSADASTTDPRTATSRSAGTSTAVPGTSDSRAAGQRAAHLPPAVAAIKTIPTVLAGVPAILRIPATVNKPPIVLWHGLGPPASAVELMNDLPLDDVPAVKVYLGLPLFGARAPAAGSDSLAQRQAQDYALRIFEPIVVGAAGELPAVLGELGRLGCWRAGEKVGLFGFSAGGTAALIALMDDKAPVGAAVTVNAPSGLRSAIGALERATKQPYVWSDAAQRLAARSDATLHASQIANTSAGQPRALLLFQGADDTTIAPADTVALDQSLRAEYEHSRDLHRLQLTVASGVSHNWADPRTVGQVRTAVADWFNRFL